MTVLTTALTGATVLRRCTIRPSLTTTWCLQQREYTYRDDGRTAPGCRACEREIAWAATGRTKTTRDIKRGEAA